MVEVCPVRSLTVYQLAIPLRRRVEHAASTRSVSEPVVIAAELADGTVGYGETLPRPYVTGETVESVVAAVREVFCNAVTALRPEQFFASLEQVDQLPMASGEGVAMPAARAAVELALLDAYSRTYQRPISEAAGWMGLAGFGFPGSVRTVRYSGVLASSRIKSNLRTLRLLWWYGLRDFKLKLGYPDDEARLAAVWRRLGPAIRRQRASLRVDANGGWSAEQCIERLDDLWDLSLAGIEQPLAKGMESELQLVHDLANAPLFHDESLITMEDAERLVGLGVAGGFNIRISKCGGLLPSLRLAEFARKRDVAIQLGCMVGETSILSAAGRRFLEVVPGVAFAEGWFGSFLLREDVVKRSLRFGYGGRGRPLEAEGLGVTVRPERLRELSAENPIVLPL